MAQRLNNGSNKSAANLGFEAELRLATDELRRNMNPAEYKHVALDFTFPVR